MTREHIDKLLESPRLNDGEKELIKWQYHMQGDFQKGLWAAICHADLDNLRKLSRGFPQEVQAYLNFSHTGIGRRKWDAIIMDHGFAMAQACGSHWRIYRPDLVEFSYATITFAETDVIIPEIARVESEHAIVILNWSPVRKVFIL